jgi:hypothetical protein
MGLVKNPVLKPPANESRKCEGLLPTIDWHKGRDAGHLRIDPNATTKRVSHLVSLTRFAYMSL